MKIIVALVAMLACVYAHAQTKWTVVVYDKVYGGVSSELTQITKQSFGLVEYVGLEAFTAIRFMNADKTPLFAGLSVALNLKKTDTGFSSSIGLGAGWVQQTQKVVPCITLSVRFN